MIATTRTRRLQEHTDSWSRGGLLITDSIKEFVYRARLRFAIGAALVLAFVDWKMFGFTLVTGNLDTVRKETYGAFATIFGALLGFVITAFSIIASLSGTVVMGRLHNEGVDEELFNGIVRAIGIIGLATVLFLGAIFVDTEKHPNIIYEYVLFGVSVWATLAVISVVFIIDSIVRAVVSSGQK